MCRKCPQIDYTSILKGSTLQYIKFQLCPRSLASLFAPRRPQRIQVAQLSVDRQSRGFIAGKLYLAAGVPRELTVTKSVDCIVCLMLWMIQVHRGLELGQQHRSDGCRLHATEQRLIIPFLLLRSESLGWRSLRSIQVSQASV